MRYPTRKQMLWIIFLLVSVVVVFLFSGCTKRQEDNAKATGAAVSRAFGLPPFVGESLVAAALATASYFGGKKRGSTVERRKSAVSRGADHG